MTSAKMEELLAERDQKRRWVTGRQLKKIRERLKLTLEDVQGRTKSKLKVSALNNLELGKVDRIAFQTAMLLSAVYGICPEEMFKLFDYEGVVEDWVVTD